MKLLKKYTLAIITSIILLILTLGFSYYVYEVPEYLVGWMACLGFYEGKGW